MKYSVMKNKSDKNVIYQRTIDIANHSMPNSVGGAVTCPDGHSQKIKFNTGLVVLYEFLEPDIRFVAFYYE